MTRIAIGTDHGGFEQKEVLRAWLVERGHEVYDVGTFEAGVSVDYPDYAHAVAHAVADGSADVGVLVCGTGLGMAIAADKVAGVRAVTVTCTDFARLAREHNNANVLCLSGRFVSEEDNQEIVNIFLSTDFEGGRHERRVAKFEQVGVDK